MGVHWSQSEQAAPGLTSCHSMTPLHARNLLLTIWTGPATPPGPTAYKRRVPQPPTSPLCPQPTAHPHRPAMTSQPPDCPQPPTLPEPGLLLAGSDSPGSHGP